MQPAVIEGWQHAPGAPADWDPDRHGHCGALPIRLDVHSGIQFMTSAWEPTPDELAALNRGAKVQLGVAGGSHPVVRIGVGPVPDPR